MRFAPTSNGDAVKDERNSRARRVMSHSQSQALVTRIRRLRRSEPSSQNDRKISDAYREILRAYRARSATGDSLGVGWHRLAHEGLSYLGGQADRHASSLADYDHHRYGPFLGVSDEGSAAAAVRQAALAAPKAVELGRRATPLTVGVALDAERLGGIGEVPVGPDEFCKIWSECVGRTLMTTNIGSRANIRLYRRAPVVTVPAGSINDALEAAKTAVATAFKPFLEASGGPRPLIVFVQFEVGSKRPAGQQAELLRSLLRYVQEGQVAAPRIHRLGLNVSIGWGVKGRDTAIRAIDLAKSVGIVHVSIDGVVRRDADQAVSLPGLLNYLPAGLAGELLAHARAVRIQLRTINQVDPDTVAREIWSALNTARAMGVDLGKYGLVPLTLEDCDRVVGQVQHWFPDWSAAPVFYIDQGIVSRRRIYTGKDTAKGVAAWLRVVARHKVRIVLIDTVDKAVGWKILKTDGDPKGILEPKQIADLNALGLSLGIKVLWAGGITLEHAYHLGKLGVFGIYVTTAASVSLPVGEAYRDDPALASEKEPTRAGVLKVKTLLEGGFLAGRLANGPRRSRQEWQNLLRKIERAGLDEAALARVLPRAWRAWWRSADR
jgi:hypothetical protein